MTSRTLIAAAAGLAAFVVLGLGIAILQWAASDRRNVGVALLAFVVFAGVWVFDWYTDLPEDQK